MSSSSENSDSETKIEKKKIQSDKVFKAYWLQDPIFMSWLLPDNSSKYKARCKVCGVSVKSGKSDLQKHAATRKHLDKMNTIKSNKNIAQMFETNIDTSHKTNVNYKITDDHVQLHNVAMYSFKNKPW